MSNPRTKEECREMFLDQVRHLCKYWDDVPKDTSLEKLEGLAFSILCIFDGSTMAMPAIDLVLRPHEDDEEYYKDRGEDWFEDGMCINDDVHLHEII